MSQTSTIAFFLLAGFLIFITMKKELPAYAGVVGIGPSAPKSS
jgi:hypothetical protein